MFEITVRPTARDAYLLVRANKLVCTSARLDVDFFESSVYNIGIGVLRILNLLLSHYRFPSMVINNSQEKCLIHIDYA